MDARNEEEASVDIVKRLKEFGARKLIRVKLRHPLASSLRHGSGVPRVAARPLLRKRSVGALAPFPFATLATFVTLPPSGPMSEFLGNALVALVFVFTVEDGL